MFSNVISAGLFQVQQFSLAQLKQEVAKALGIDKSRIERLECWPHQLWVVITGVRARFVSYRILPSWIAKVVEAIGKVVNFEQLQQLGNLLRRETPKHDYQPEAVAELREAYRQKQEELKAIKPQLDHQKEAQEWLEGWQKVVKHCYTPEAIDPVMTAMDIQIEEFLDLPEIVAKAQEIISNQLFVISDE